jgi:hypothetical protein
MVAPTIAKAFDVEFLRSVVQGPIWNHFRKAGESSITLDTILCPFGHAFIGKGRMGSHGRSISRNGLVLLMSRSSVAELENGRVRVRLAIWHRSHLRGERAKPWGILLCANILEASCGSRQLGDFMRTVVAGGPMAEAALSIDLGGERTLNFLASGSNPRSDILFGKQRGNNRGC